MINAAQLQAEAAQNGSALVVNLAPFAGTGTLTIWAQIGADEPMIQNGQVVAMRFKDLPTAEVAKKLEVRRAALARGPSRALGHRD